MLICFRNSQEVSVAGVKKAMGRVVQNEPMGSRAGASSGLSGQILQAIVRPSCRPYLLLWFLRKATIRDKTIQNGHK